jgi:hypothetical protein
MKKLKTDPVREDRIHNEAIADANGPEEQVMGWYYYLDDKIRFPFQDAYSGEIDGRQSNFPMGKNAWRRTISVPGWSRSAFRGEADQRSGVKPISVPGWSRSAFRLIPIRWSERSDAGDVIVYQVIKIVKKKLRKIKIERFRSEATLTRCWVERKVGSWSEQLGGRAGIWGAGERGGIEPLYPPQLSFSVIE